MQQQRKNTAPHNPDTGSTPMGSLRRTLHEENKHGDPRVFKYSTIKWRKINYCISFLNFGRCWQGRWSNRKDCFFFFMNMLPSANLGSLINMTIVNVICQANTVWQLSIYYNLTHTSLESVHAIDKLRYIYRAVFEV